MLLTRAPLYSWYCYHFLVRLACVRHAASVDSEPGSNSRLKLFVLPSPTEVGSGSTVFALESSEHSYLVRMIKPNLIFSHDWHVQPICQRSFRVNRLSGPFRIEAQTCVGVSSNLLRSPVFAYYRIHRRFCANLLNISNFPLHVKPLFTPRPRPLKLVVDGLFSVANFNRPERVSCP